MKKILFLIHDLGQGGAEKVLVNLVNNMDHNKFDITVMTLFDYGENRQFLNSNIKYKTWCKKVFRGNSHLMKLLSPEQLHSLIIKDKYDIEVAYLEGPCARVISGCTDTNTKKVAWIHIEQHTAKRAANSFRSVKEAQKCYGKFDRIISVSKTVENDFRNALSVNGQYEVLYNTNESEKIKQLGSENVKDVVFSKDKIKLVGVGKLLVSKGFDRILRITKKLIDEGYPVQTYILGEGPERESLEKYIKESGLEEYVKLLGYQLNPYKYISKCDLFVCASLAEGFSTAATEALILGIPVCTVEVSGMKEMLGEYNEFGVITDNAEESLYEGIKSLIRDSNMIKYYTSMARIRGKDFITENTVTAVQDMLDTLFD